ncbi:hypothetical protein C5137_28785 [Bacillus cereus]|uniref:hypothetical protein n=1 Tax=Bacillus TaxID=1386 RepID=UPI0008EAD727|nr:MULTISPECIES: hypothetical protein [Bacillus]MCI3150082.1 hypothetical protein [Bacillus cereus]SFL29917.1 hypothetical protein SAMN04488573_1021254 [Bacillus sp. 5mfcol3.1]
MDTQQIIVNLSNKLNNKPFADHEDDVTRRNRLGIPYCHGNERWAEGQTSTSEITVHVENENDPWNLKISCHIKLPYQAKYRRKIFHGVGCEYDTEHKDCSGLLEFDAILTMGGGTIQNLTNVNPDPSTAHDSTRMCQEGIHTDILNHLFVQ